MHDPLEHTVLRKRQMGRELPGAVMKPMWRLRVDRYGVRVRVLCDTEGVGGGRAIH